RLQAHDCAAAAWSAERRGILDQIQDAHDLLWEVTCLNGRRPARPGEPPLPPTTDDPIYLDGRRLRATCLAILLSHGRQSLPRLHSLLHLYGYAVGNRRPGKALADA